MATFSKVLLSGSSNGRGIKVAATSSPGTLLHATGTSATIQDEIWIWVYNGDTVTRTITLEIAGTSVPDDNLVMDIPPKSGRILILDGLPISGTGSASNVRAFCPTANVLVVTGYVNRIT